MKGLSGIVFSLFFIGSVASAEPKNEIPLYGSKAKSKEEIAADEKFISEATKAAGSREKAFTEILNRAWDALQKGDLVLATKRFNQAYLLNPNDYQPFWGLGTLAGIQAKTSESISLFEKGYKISAKNPRFLCDYGFALVNAGLSLSGSKDANEKIPPLLTAAEGKYLEAQKIDPKIAIPYSRLAVLDYYRGDFIAAWKNVSLSQERGGEGLDPRFLTDLEKASPRPKK